MEYVALSYSAEHQATSLVWAVINLIFFKVPCYEEVMTLQCVLKTQIMCDLEHNVNAVSLISLCYSFDISLLSHFCVLLSVK